MTDGQPSDATVLHGWHNLSRFRISSNMTWASTFWVWINEGEQIVADQPAYGWRDSGCFGFAHIRDQDWGLG